jgi:polysaccharide biosynthesis protein PslJ
VTAGRSPVPAISSSVHAAPLIGPSWPLVVLFVLHPLWWLLGLTLIVPGVTAVLLILALSRRVTLLPPGTGCWLLLLGWIALSFISIDDLGRLLAAGYRASIVLAAVLLLLWIASHDERHLPTRTILTCVVVLWATIVVGGWLGILFPDVRFPALLTPLVPGALRSIPLVDEVLTVEFATVSRILSRPIVRPEAPFTFTNAWGANLALVVPFVLASRRGRSSGYRTITLVVLALSVVPIVTSMNRGLWVGLTAGAAYAAIRFAATGHPRALAGVLLAVVLAGVAVTSTPLGDIATQRAETGHSDDARLDLYTQAIELTARSPILGYGAPQESLRGGASVGTHGQLWLLLVSYGVPGTLLYLGWYAVVLVRTRRGSDPTLTWMRTVLVISLVQLPFYEQLPLPLMLVVTAGALALRHTGTHDATGRAARTGSASWR